MEPFEKLALMFLQTQLAKINNKQVIAENQCENKKIELSSSGQTPRPIKNLGHEPFFDFFKIEFGHTTLRMSL